MVFIGDLCERDVESQVIGRWFGFSHFFELENARSSSRTLNKKNKNKNKNLE